MNDVKQKAKMLLAGLAVLPAVASASKGIQPNAYYQAPYDDGEQQSNQSGDAQLTRTTGLTIQQLQEARTLVSELNSKDVVDAKSMNLTKAPIMPYNYNMPAPQDVEAARVKNLDRLAKLRAMIEAAK